MESLTTTGIIVDIVVQTSAMDVVVGGTTTISNNGESTWDELIAATNIGGHYILAIEPNGKAAIASSSTVWCRHTIKGIATNAAIAGAVVRIITRGLIQEPSWNWIPGKPVFLSSNGLPTQTPPEMGFIVQVGVAFSPTSIFVFIRPSIVLGD